MNTMEAGYTVHCHCYLLAQTLILISEYETYYEKAPLRKVSIHHTWEELGLSSHPTRATHIRTRCPSAATWLRPSPESQSTHEIAEARGNPLFNFRSVLHNTADPFRRVVHSVIRPQIVRTPRDHIHSGDVISIYSFLAIQRPSLPPSPFPYREWTVAAAILVSYSHGAASRSYRSFYDSGHKYRFLRFLFKYYNFCQNLPIKVRGRDTKVLSSWSNESPSAAVLLESFLRTLLMFLLVYFAQARSASLSSDLVSHWKKIEVTKVSYKLKRPL